MGVPGSGVQDVGGLFGYSGRLHGMDDQRSLGRQAERRVVGGKVAGPSASLEVQGFDRTCAGYCCNAVLRYTEKCIPLG